MPPTLKPPPVASLAAAARLRPMAFGQHGYHRVEDPICEPLWGGRRVLVEVSGAGTRIRDTDAQELEGYDALRDAIADATMADEALYDGALLPAPLRDSEGARVRVGMDALETASGRVKRMFVGSTAAGRAREDLARADAARAPAPGTEAAAFVATDLLWLDGQSLLDVPLQERKRILESVLDERELVRRTMAVRPPVEAWFAQWRALGFEEVVYKAANGRYHPGTVSEDWTIALMPRR